MLPAKSELPGRGFRVQGLWDSLLLVPRHVLRPLPSQEHQDCGVSLPGRVQTMFSPEDLRVAPDELRGSLSITCSGTGLQRRFEHRQRQDPIRSSRSRTHLGVSENRGP